MLDEKFAKLVWENTPKSIYDVLPFECFQRHDVNDYVTTWTETTKQMEADGVDYKADDTWLDKYKGRPCFETYYALAKILKPTSFLEIGVRFAYSLIPSLIGGEQTIKTAIGIDLETYGNNDIATANLKEFYKGEIKWDLRHGNSQEMTELPQFFDLVSIDGCHEYGCKVHDLKLAMNNSSYAILDDYDYHQDVRRATDDFMRDFAHNIESSLYLPTFRGSMIIEFKENVDKVLLQPTNFKD